jgi:hypothetical protein
MLPATLHRSCSASSTANRFGCSVTMSDCVNSSGGRSPFLAAALADFFDTTAALAAMTMTTRSAPSDHHLARLLID